MAMRHPGPCGGTYRKNKALCLQASNICHLCGHPGASQADHIITRKDWPRGPDGKHLPGLDDLPNLAPAHGHDDRTGASGVDYRCFTCGRACNQERKTRALDQPYRSRSW